MENKSIVFQNRRMLQEEEKIDEASDIFLTVELTKMCSGYIIITLVSVAQGIEHGPPKAG